jgi:hypothetical protein
MLGILLSIISILGFGLYVNRLAKIPLEISLVCACSSLILILFLAGLVGYLEFASQLLLVVGVGSFIYSRWRNRGVVQFNLSAIVFLFISTVVLLVLSTLPLYSHFSTVDDYSHWGIVAKIISNEGRLITSTDAVSFKSYPPGMALFYSFFLQLGNYSEHLVIFSNALFVMVLYVPLFSVIPKDCNKYVLFGMNAFLYVLLSSIAFTGALRTIGVDMVLGLMFGMALFIYLSNRKQGRLKAILVIAPLVIVLPVIKLIGILFSLVIIGVIVCDIFVGVIARRDKLKLLVLSILIATATLLIYKVWGLHVTNMGVMPDFDISISVDQVVQAFTPSQVAEREKIIINNFVHRFTNIKDFSNLVLIGCLLFLSIIWQSGTQFAPKERVTPFVAIFLGYYGYLFVLLLLYLFFFGSYEGTLLASYRRYTNTYLLGMVIAFIGVTLSQYCAHKQSRRLTISLFLICLITVAPNLKNRTLLEVNRIINGEVPLENYFKHANKVKKLTPQGSRIYLIWQGQSQDVGTILRYYVSPRSINSACYSVGDVYPHANGDPWTCQMTSREFSQMIIHYDYLYIAHADIKFNEKYLNQFDLIGTEDGNLFQIVKESSNGKLISIKDGSAKLRLAPVTSPSMN